MTKLLTEPCRPYDMDYYRSKDPVDVWEIVRRLTPYQIQRLAIALAMHKPDVFEERILQFWAERPVTTDL
jgi:hypothetical protein